MSHRAEDIEAVAVLEEPSRRALYEWVVAQRQPVSRDAAAAGVGVSRALAAFHLDRLVREELLVPEYRRLSGRTGPGAGRPAKLYRRGPREVAVSLPDRHYEVAARVMAESMQRIGQGELPEELRASAHGTGLAVGADARRQAGPRPVPGRLKEALIATLAERGYEPHEGGPGEIRLGNCPFHALVEDHRDVVCGMNLALAEGILGGLHGDDLEAFLDPQPGHCCVAIRPISRP
jgi:predicted ArsR family transcriptional regulator